MKSSTGQILWLFFGTFASAFLFMLGLAGLLLLLVPAIAGAWQTTPVERPQLPLAQARDNKFIDPEALPGPELFPSPPPEAVQVEPGNWIRIPSIGVNVPIVLSASMEDDDVLATLDKGAALYPNGVRPGRLGNLFVAAHSTGNPWHGKYRFAFLKINQIETGNFIYIDYEGTRYTYRVTSQEIITPTPDYRVISDRPVPTLTLMACWPLWSTSKRMMTHSELVSVTLLARTI